MSTNKISHHHIITLMCIFVSGVIHQLPPINGRVLCLPFTNHSCGKQVEQLGSASLTRNELHKTELFFYHHLFSPLEVIELVRSLPAVCFATVYYSISAHQFIIPFTMVFSLVPQRPQRNRQRADTVQRTGRAACPG